jgi:hypothetical protein
MTVLRDVLGFRKTGMAARTVPSATLKLGTGTHEDLVDHG